MPLIIVASQRNIRAFSATFAVSEAILLPPRKQTARAIGSKAATKGPSCKSRARDCCAARRPHATAHNPKRCRSSSSPAPPAPRHSSRSSQRASLRVNAEEETAAPEPAAARTGLAAKKTSPATARTRSPLEIRGRPVRGLQQCTIKFATRTIDATPTHWSIFAWPPGARLRAEPHRGPPDPLGSRSGGRRVEHGDHWLPAPGRAQARPRRDGRLRRLPRARAGHHAPPRGSTI